MKKRQIGNITLYFDPSEESTADLVAGVIDETSWILRSRWSLEIPSDCHLIVMTSWQQFFFNAAPLAYRFGLVISLPLWVWRVKAMWRVAGGWTNRFGHRVAVGVKPPSLLAGADRRIGERIFVSIDDPREKVRQITCHELTHAASAARKLPMWLNEGFATRTVDHLAGYPTIRADTLQLLSSPDTGVKPLGYRNLRLKDQESIVYEYARGYWLTRLLDEQYPDKLTNCMTKGSDRSQEDIVAEALGLPRDELWAALNPLLLEHFAIEAELHRK